MRSNIYIYIYIYSENINIRSKLSSRSSFFCPSSYISNDNIGSWDFIFVGPHLIQGIGSGIIPFNLDLTIVDEIIKVSKPEMIYFLILNKQSKIWNLLI